MNTILNLVAQIGLICYPFRLEKKLDRLRNKIYTARLSGQFGSFGRKVSIRRPLVLCNARHISVGDAVSIYPHVILAAHETGNGIPRITIGEGTVIGEYSHLTAIRRIHIGKNVLTGRRVTITDNSHGRSTHEEMSVPPSLRKLVSNGGVVIEDNVWLGDNVVILPGVKIGRGSIIGANAVVTVEIPSYCVAVGNPARVVKHISRD